jgi:hypothetical protein
MFASEQLEHVVFMDKLKLETAPHLLYKMINDFNVCDTDLNHIPHNTL